MMVPDEPFCLDDEIEVVVGQVDVRHKDDIDEPLLLKDINADV